MNDWLNLFRRSPIVTPRQKFQAEARFWRTELNQYLAWYHGQIKLYGTASPREEQKITNLPTIEKNAVATWTKLYQEPRYLDDLMMPADAFHNQRVLDIGCGPVASARCFVGAEVYGLDHLIDVYRDLGYPIDEYNHQHFHFIQAKSEQIPFEDHFFDAVISANAIDHVDDLDQTSRELQRVLKPGGTLAMHIHYHPPTETEPLELNDAIVERTFSWVTGLRRVAERQVKDLGFTHAPSGESYCVWSNSR